MLSNAIKFTPPGGTVIARAGVGAAGLYVQIIDTGIGIAEEDMPKVLERFGQVDSSLARRYEGAGLGIPISMELMKVHDGTLEIQSVVGKGTTITITLPPGASSTWNMPLSLKQRPMQDRQCHREIDHQPRHIHQGGDEGRRCACRIEAEPFQDERQHRAR